MFYLLQINKKDPGYLLGYDIGSFITDNIYLIAGLLIGIIVAIVMRKTLKTKP